MQTTLIPAAQAAFATALQGWSTGFELVNLHPEHDDLCLVVPEGHDTEACDIVVDLIRQHIPQFQVSAHGAGKTLVITGCSLEPGAICVMGRFSLEWHTQQLVAQDGYQFPNLRACFDVLCEDVIGHSVEDAAFEAYVLPILLAKYTQDQLVLADLSVGTIRSEGDTANLESRLWTLCAGEETERAVMVQYSLTNGHLVDGVVAEMFDGMGDL